MTKRLTSDQRTFRVRYKTPEGHEQEREFDKEEAYCAFLLASHTFGEIELFDDGEPCGVAWRNSSDGPWLIRKVRTAL